MEPPLHSLLKVSANEKWKGAETHLANCFKRCIFDLVNAAIMGFKAMVTTMVEDHELTLSLPLDEKSKDYTNS